MTASETLVSNPTTENTSTAACPTESDPQLEAVNDREQTERLREAMRSEASINIDELRSFVRKPVRTQTSVVVVGDNGRSTYKAWSNDISPGGMSLVSCDPIDGKDVLLSILLPGLADQLVRGRIVYTAENDHHQFRYNYGVQFLGVDKNEDLGEGTNDSAES